MMEVPQAAGVYGAPAPPDPIVCNRFLWYLGRTPNSIESRLISVRIAIRIGRAVCYGSGTGAKETRGTWYAI